MGTWRWFRAGRFWGCGQLCLRISGRKRPKGPKELRTQTCSSEVERIWVFLKMVDLSVGGQRVANIAILGDRFLCSAPRDPLCKAHI